MRNRYALILTVLLALGAGSAVAADSAMVSGFNVTKYGFHFNNYFTGSILISVPLIGQINFGGTSYGLCGGMSYSAYDDYLYNVAAPTDSTPFAPGTAHRSYVYNRQDDSFKADNAFMIRRFIEWIALPIDSNFATTGLQVRSHRQFKRIIKPQLESGKPIVVGLLRADLGDLTTMGQGNALLKNHQVLAVGFSLHTLSNGHQEWTSISTIPIFTTSSRHCIPLNGWRRPTEARRRLVASEPSSPFRIRQRSRNGRRRRQGIPCVPRRSFQPL